MIKRRQLIGNLARVFLSKWTVLNPHSHNTLNPKITIDMIKEPTSEETILARLATLVFLYLPRLKKVTMTAAKSEKTTTPQR